MSDTDIVTYEEVRQLGNDKNVLLVDVREPNEIEKTGLIPGSINIPLSDLKAGLESDEFLEKHGRDKPASEFPLIFSCHAGRRAAKARDIALEMGYKNVRYYPGSWAEWESKTKQ